MQPLIPTVHAALRAATSYLLSQQADDGSWRDYFGLPMGPSDAWVTAYVALCLSQVEPVDDDVADATARAVAWLRRTRPYAAGWGYNAATGPDADTTAHVLRLLRHHGLPVEPRDQAWLLGRWRAPGGFSTYDGPDAWGSVHACVTPVAYAALAEPDRQRLRDPMREYLYRHRLPNGAWPAYWWRTCHYATYHNLRLARALGVTLDDARPVVAAHPSFEVRSAFDLAFVVGGALLAQDAAAEPSAGMIALVRTLLDRQRHAGSFMGAGNLRVTHHECHEPWRRAVGRLYVDDRHTITTASAVLVLGAVWERWRCAESRAMPSWRASGGASSSSVRRGA